MEYMDFLRMILISILTNIFHDRFYISRCNSEYIINNIYMNVLMFQIIL